MDEMKQYKIKALEEKHILSTILFLGENGVTSKTTLYENVSKNPRMPDKLCELEKVGLLNVRSGYPTSIELTSKGKAVYEFLRDRRHRLNHQSHFHNSFFICSSLMSEQS